ncbi:MAG: hypothetical protein JNJ55_05695, partial [Betaproteobacteria bacterium]|nr:hypothetical protein [Betaproteobacteria bacterium]
MTTRSTFEQDVHTLESALADPDVFAHLPAATALIARLGEDGDRAPGALVARAILAAARHWVRAGKLAEGCNVLALAHAFGDRVPPAERIELLVLEAGHAVERLDLGHAIDMAAAGFHIAQASGEESRVPSLLAAYSTALNLAGLPAEAERVMNRALTLNAALPENKRQSGRLWINAYHALMAQDKFDEAIAACKNAIALSDSTDPFRRDSIWCLAYARHAGVALLKGDVPTAEALIRLARATLGGNLRVRDRWALELIEALFAVAQDNTESARAHVEAVLTRGEDITRGNALAARSNYVKLLQRLGDEKSADAEMRVLAESRLRAYKTLIESTRYNPDNPTQPPTSSQSARMRVLAPPVVQGAAASAGSLELLERLAVTAEFRDDTTGK